MYEISLQIHENALYQDNLYNKMGKANEKLFSSYAERIEK